MTREISDLLDALAESTAKMFTEKEIPPGYVMVFGKLYHRKEIKRVVKAQDALKQKEKDKRRADKKKASAAGVSYRDMMREKERAKRKKLDAKLNAKLAPQARKMGVPLAKLKQQHLHKQAEKQADKHDRLYKRAEKLGMTTRQLKLWRAAERKAKRDAAKGAKLGAERKKAAQQGANA